MVSQKFAWMADAGQRTVQCDQGVTGEVTVGVQSRLGSWEQTW